MRVVGHTHALLDVQVCLNEWQLDRMRARPWNVAEMPEHLIDLAIGFAALLTTRRYELHAADRLLSACIDSTS